MRADERFVRLKHLGHGEAYLLVCGVCLNRVGSPAELLATNCMVVDSTFAPPALKATLFARLEQAYT